MHIRLIWVGRTERGYVADGVREYVGRVERVAELHEVVVAESTVADVARRRSEESARILGVLKAGERLVVLDERGTLMSSRAFAERLGAWRDHGTRRLAFVVGGAHGVTDEVRERADLVLALSPMVFPHQLVRVVFAEQLYRAFSILRGSGYHHE